MKKVLLFSASCLMLLSACKKENKPTKTEEPTAAKYPVSFTATSFTESTAPISSDEKKTSAIVPLAQSNSFSMLHYLVYDSNGKEVSHLEQTKNETKLYRINAGTRKLISSNNPYGTIKDSLPAGTYTVVMAAGDNGSSFNGNKTISIPSQVYTDPYVSLGLNDAKFYFGLPGLALDAVYYKDQLQVAPGQTTKTVTLNRITSQLTVQLEDAIPAEVTSLDVTIVGEMTYFRVNTNAPEGVKDNSSGVFFNPSDIGKLNYRRTQTILNTTTPVTVIISAVDRLLRPLYTKTITNVRFKANEVTTLTGKLFDGKVETGIAVNVNPDWSTTPQTIKF